MKKLIAIFIILIIPGLCDAFPAMISKVIDGDTIIVFDGENYLQIRLCGIDAPELDQLYGKESKEYLSRLLGSKVKGGKVRMIDIKPVAKGAYGYTVAWVTVKRRNKTAGVGHEMLKAGMAWYYPKFAPGNKRLMDLERSAKSNHIGLWLEPTPIPPWEYRKGQ